MSARIHVRIHSQGNGRFHSQFASHLVQAIKLGVGFDIETANAGLQGPLHFPLLLANAGEYDFTGIPAGTKHTFKLSGRDYVKTGPQTSQHIEHGQIAVCLDRITHQMRAILQGLIVSTVMALQRRPGIDVGWRTKALGDIGNGNVFGVEFAVTVIEVIHAVPESLRSGWSGSGPFIVLIGIFARLRICLGVTSLRWYGVGHRRVPVQRPFLATTGYHQNHKHRERDGQAAHKPKLHTQSPE